MNLLNEVDVSFVSGAASSWGDYAWGMGGGAAGAMAGLGPWGSAAASGMSILISDFVKAYDPNNARIPLGIVSPSWTGNPNFTKPYQPSMPTWRPGSSTPWRP